jgi:hypothetical protein
MTSRQTHISYKPGDFILYCFSLFVCLAVGWLVLPHSLGWAAFAIASTVYLLVTFVIKHGVRLDHSCFPEIVRGCTRYPRRAINMLRANTPPRVLITFAFAVGAESVYRRYVPAGSLWLRPVPVLHCFWVALLVVSAYRTILLITHLRHRSHVATVLAESPWRHQLVRLGPTNHVIHGYVTGIVTHLCLLMPMIGLWSVTAPTYLREVILLAVSAARLTLAMRRYGVSIDSYLHAFVASRMLQSITLAHEEDHRGRFEFAVFHGHHHDAIPSGIMAGLEAGFVEAIDRGAWLAACLDSVVVRLIVVTINSIRNIIGHQYIPGVFPYSRTVINWRVHHISHHYGSLLPLGLGGLMTYGSDLDAGYDPRNAKVRWFLDAAKRYEMLDDEAAEHFVDLSVLRPG